MNREETGKLDFAKAKWNREGRRIGTKAERLRIRVSYFGCSLEPRATFVGSMERWIIRLWACELKGFGRLYTEETS